jgi:hypothetical protein
MFRHFPGALSITPDDLLDRYGSQQGIWLAFSAPARNELGTTTELGYYQGVFEDVLEAVLFQHPHAFLDAGMCGEIVPIVPVVVPSPFPSDAEAAVLHQVFQRGMQ